MRGRMNGEGLSCYTEDIESNPNLGIYYDDTFKEKSKRLDELGMQGFKGEFMNKMKELRENTPALPTEEVDKLKKEYEKTYLTDNKYQIQAMQRKVEEQELRSHKKLLENFIPEPYK